MPERAPWGRLRRVLPANHPRHQPPTPLTSHGATARRRDPSAPVTERPASSRRPPPARRRAELAVAFSADAATLDPRLAFNVPAQSISRHLYEPLVHHDMRGQLRPGLATSWRWRDGNRTLDLTLQPGVRSHTGAVMTACDVKYTFDTTLGPEARSRQKPTLFYIADTEIL